jgi:FSR family fosmidomycin resistance protein-like MFS transporter
MNKKKVLINLIFCSIMHGLNHFFIIFFKPMYIQMSDYFSLKNVSDMTVKMTIIYLGYASSNFISGILSRKYSRKIILFSGMFLMSSAVIAMGFVPRSNFNLAVILVFLMGLGGGVYHPAANTLITSMYEKKQGHAIGMLSIGSAIGFILAPFIGEYIGAKLIGFKSLFLICGLTGIVFNFLFILFVKEEKIAADPDNSSKVLNESDKSQLSPAVFVLLIALLCIPVALREIENWSFYEITPYWVNNGFSKGLTVSLIQSMQYIPSLFIQPFIGKMCDRFGSLRIVIITFGLCGIGIALFSISNIFTLWIAMMLFGAGMGSATVASETYMAGLSNAKNRSMIYGIVLSVGLAVGGRVSGISGWVVDLFGKDHITGYNVWYILIGSVLLLSLPIYFILEKIRMTIKT